MPDIRRVPPERTHALRQLVLRPHQDVALMSWKGDDAPGAAHFASFVGERIVAVGSVMRDAPPGSADPDAWRLRGMATHPDARGQGHGAAIVRAALDHARAMGGSLLWFNARTGALGFYEKLGFVRHGEEFHLPDAGPHVVMDMRLRT